VNGRLNLAMMLEARRNKEQINDYEKESKTPAEEPKGQRECRGLPMRRVLFLRTWVVQLRALRVQITRSAARIERTAWAEAQALPSLKPFGLSHFDYPD
jgi:hypothetical protein